MTYEALKKIAQPHIREYDSLPSNSLLLLNQLHMSFKNKQQCEQDFGCKMNPLYNTPAFLLIDDDGNKTVYADLNAQYWNFYIFHEIAHYLLGHEDDSPQHEMDANMLACILIAPVENLPTTLKTARDLSCACSIPIDKAEEYWDIIRDEVCAHPHIIQNKLIMAITCIVFALLFFVGVSWYMYDAPIPNDDVSTTNQTIIVPAPKQITKHNGEESNFYMTSSGTHYHIQNCQYIKDKNNIISISLEEAENLHLEPCKKCID